MEAQKDEDHRPDNATASQQPAQKPGKVNVTDKIAPMNIEERMKLLESLMLAQGFKENCIAHDQFAHCCQEQLLNLAQFVTSPDKSDEPEISEAVEADEAGNTLSECRYNSACTPSFESACATLGADKKAMTYDLGNQKTVPLKAWQITGCAWMIEQEEGPIKGGMLTDACGTGKTLIALTTIYHQASRSGGPPMKPTLIVCPPTVIEVWMNEIDRFFKGQFRVFVFLGFSRYNQKKWKDHVFNGSEVLKKRLLESDPNGPGSGRTIVITSYDTWLERSCTEILPNGDKTIIANQLSDIDEIIESISNNRRTTKAKQGNKKYSTKMMGVFDRVVCDEANSVKNMFSGRHQSIALLKASHVWLITATPIWNRAVDMVGYLSLLHKPSVDQNSQVGSQIDGVRESSAHNSSHGQIPSSTTSIEAYRAYENVQFKRGMSLPTHLLSPQSVERLAQSPEGWAQFGSYVLPVLMGMISLSRKIGDRISIGLDREDVFVGDEIPPMTILTVDLRFPEEQQVQHNEIYLKHVDKLVEVTADTTVDGVISTIPKRLGFQDFGVERMLRLAAFSPRLHDFVEAVEQNDTYRPEIDAPVPEDYTAMPWIESGLATVPSSAYEIANYLAQSSPKLRYMLQIFANEGILSQKVTRDTPRLLIFCLTPFVLWQVEMFLAALGIEYMAIRSGDAMARKFGISSDFKHSTNTARVLLTTFERGSLGLNLHVRCSRVIILESPGTLGKIRQVIGRVHRIGQRQGQKVWILFQNHTIERWVEYSLACKAIPELIATMGIRKRQNDRADASVQEALGDDENGQAMVAAQLVRMLGQSESRLKYNNPHDLGDPRFDGPLFGGEELNMRSLSSNNTSSDNPADSDMPDCEGEVHEDTINSM